MIRRPTASPEFGRVMTAMVTPFDSEGNLNLPRIGELIEFLANNGTDGLVIAGTTGESPTLTHEEHKKLLNVARESTGMPILAGTGSNSTEEAIDITEYVDNLNLADGVLAVSPYYNRPSQAGIEHYYRELADAAGDLPVIIYDIPTRTGRKVATETIIRLANEVPNIRGLKDAAGNPEETERVIRNVPDDFMVYSGDDSLNMALSRRGAVGAISVASHWAGNVMQAMYDSSDRGDSSLMMRLDSALNGSYKFESGDQTPNPHPAKAMMRLLGIDVGYCRSPMRLGVSYSDMIHAEEALELKADLVYRSLANERVVLDNEIALARIN